MWLGILTVSAVPVRPIVETYVYACYALVIGLLCNSYTLVMSCFA